jgi:hypothetical protein
MDEATHITVRIGPHGPVRTFNGRFAWTLSQLIIAGQRGVTPIDQPAPRWSHYVYRLRRDGIPIRTVPEKHGGAFPGRHGRYVIAAAVTVVGDSEMKEEAA